MKKRILLSAGGTGGHMFPAGVLASNLIEQGFDVQILTDKRGSSYLSKSLPKKVYNLSFLGRRRIWNLPFVAFQMMVLALGTLWNLLFHRPALIVGFGGYVTYPVLLFARLLKIPYCIHEQNSVLGRVNRIFKNHAKVVMTSFPQTVFAGRVYYTGLPVREEFVKIRSQPYKAPEHEFNLLVLGGSQGSKIFSNLIPAALSRLPDEYKKQVRVVQQCRSEDVKDVEQFYGSHGIKARAYSFINHVADEIAKAHFIISRSGASSLAEMTVAGRPALYIPYLFAMDDHQTTNAKQLCDQQGGWMMPQGQVTPEMIKTTVLKVMKNKGLLIRAAASAKAFGRPDALEDMSREIKKIV